MAKILLIDDDKQMLEVVTPFLERERTAAIAGFNWQVLEIPNLILYGTCNNEFTKQLPAESGRVGETIACYPK